ncbi:MAG: hypothetical protein HQL67_08845 [Magnetococcales bacterium]|nr:hypothetical protein [Magnetococcales bacterium]
MKPSLSLLFILVLMGFCVDLQGAELAAEPEFSADVVRSEIRPNKRVTRGKMFVSRYGVRTEGIKNGQKIVVIFRPKKQIVWTLFPDLKRYDERVGLVVDRPPLPRDPNSPCQKRESGFSCQLLGEREVNGRMTEHWLVLRPDKNKLNAVVQFWIDSRLKIAVREQFPDGMVVDLLNIVEEIQPVKAFVVPFDYVKNVAEKAKPTQ